MNVHGLGTDLTGRFCGMRVLCINLLKCLLADNADVKNYFLEVERSYGYVRWSDKQAVFLNAACYKGTCARPTNA